MNRFWSAKMNANKEKRNPLGNWHNTASVRKEQAPTDYDTPNGFWTSPDLVPIVNHPEVIRSGTPVIQEILARAAHRSQDFTEQLEMDIVVPLTTKIAQRKLKRFELDNKAVTNARLIVIDECQHANCASTIIDRLAKFLGNNTPETGEFAFIEQIKAQQTYDQRETELVEVGSVIVCETLITKGLVRLARDESLDSGVSAFSRDHMLDEAGHHAYFSQLLEKIWSPLTYDEKAFLGGEVMPNAINMYLRLNRKCLYADLQVVGFSSTQAERIIDDTYVECDVLQVKRDSAKATLHHMKSAGMYEHPAVIASLKANKLI
jgi:P-aminobenzoate N-oxygenase AurF